MKKLLPKYTYFPTLDSFTAIYERVKVLSNNANTKFTKDLK